MQAQLTRNRRRAGLRCALAGSLLLGFVALAGLPGLAEPLLAGASQVAATQPNSTPPNSTPPNSTSLSAPPATATPATVTTGPAMPASAIQPPSTPAAPQPASQPATLSAADRYGLWVLAPPLITIVLAIVMQQVLPALSIGILIAAYMQVECLPAGAPFAGSLASGDVLNGVQLAVEGYLIGAISDVDHVKVMLFSLSIGGMIGVISANGGTKAVVDRVARWANSRQRGQLVTWFAGMIVFFDDYANAMIVGPAMRPVCDRLRISRAKLAYLVDSTAAPVASLAFVGTWIATEVSFINDGLNALTSRPAFLDGIEGYGTFWQSVPYRYYPILALAMVVWVALLNRDFGPMWRSESDARPIEDDAAPVPSHADAGPKRMLTPGPHKRPKMWYAVVPVLTLIALALGLLLGPPLSAFDFASFQPPAGTPYPLALVEAVMSQGIDPFTPMVYGGLGSLAVALLISMMTGANTLGEAVDAATNAMSRLFPTIVVLVLAWTLSGAIKELELGRVAVEYLSRTNLNDAAGVVWFPTIVFASSCIVSFATGTSWGTMGILVPAVVTIASGLIDACGLPADRALELFYASVGSVLAGSVFGDHCSPISDTTVLSALASECSVEEHVWTQMPYALVTAVVGVLAGEVLCRWQGYPNWLGLIVGVLGLGLILLVVGRRPRRVVA